VLRDAVRRLAVGRPPREALAAIPDGTRLHGRLPDGRGVSVPVERVRPLVEALIELFDRNSGGSLNLAQAGGLAEVMAAIGARWMGASRIAGLISALQAAAEGGITVGPPPEGFLFELRPYQKEGVAWMRFLAANGLGGVLADDMGLGKTIQALAHLLEEKNAGRATTPSLVVCPTSVVPVWTAKALEAAPGLRVVVLHGAKRAELREAAKTADLVVTTYPLLVRDEAFLTSVSWHAVILDEAQAIKNPTTKWTQVACRLRAHHRLCLTGTPVENHLGEAWAQFAFLMPGILGDAKAFGRDFRRPIEESGDTLRRVLLARRLKPFILRRTKAAVATELPPKTEIIEKVAIEGAQRGLYETVRLAMDAKVRDAIGEHGLARSHIIVLDALLKLRQICCAPALLKGAMGAKAAKAESAKLERLMEMLPQMVEEGRRILLFSQFTEMLDLIKERLDAEGIAYVEITGDTKDRATPVRRFQAGEVPLFLISLKAGGTGLTLTAADTVIHYDPWWNPAVEDQATDRAHRIGQDKPVFVYKFIVSGTVEEKMVELQARKRDLAAAVFDPDAADSIALRPEDVAALFAPLDDDEALAA